MAGTTGSVVRDDVKGVAKTTEKATKDIGHAAVDLADKAGNGLQDAANKASAGGQDTWITTKVESALTSDSFDPLHVPLTPRAVKKKFSVQSIRRPKEKRG